MPDSDGDKGRGIPPQLSQGLDPETAYLSSDDSEAFSTDDNHNDAGFSEFREHVEQEFGENRSASSGTSWHTGELLDLNDLFEDKDVDLRDIPGSFDFEEIPDDIDFDEPVEVEKPSRRNRIVNELVKYGLVLFVLMLLYFLQAVGFMAGALFMGLPLEKVTASIYDLDQQHGTARMNVNIDMFYRYPWSYIHVQTIPDAPIKFRIILPSEEHEDEDEEAKKAREERLVDAVCDIELIQRHGDKPLLYLGDAPRRYEIEGIQLRLNPNFSTSRLAGFMKDTKHEEYPKKMHIQLSMKLMMLSFAIPFTYPISKAFSIDLVTVDPAAKELAAKRMAEFNWNPKSIDLTNSTPDLVELQIRQPIPSFFAPSKFFLNVELPEMHWVLRTFPWPYPDKEPIPDNALTASLRLGSVTTRPLTMRFDSAGQLTNLLDVSLTLEKRDVDGALELLRAARSGSLAMHWILLSHVDYLSDKSIEVGRRLHAIAQNRIRSRLSLQRPRFRSFLPENDKFFAKPIIGVPLNAFFHQFIMLLPLQRFLASSAAIGTLSDFVDEPLRYSRAKDPAFHLSFINAYRLPSSGKPLKRLHFQASANVYYVLMQYKFDLTMIHGILPQVRFLVQVLRDVPTTAAAITIEHYYPDSGTAGSNSLFIFDVYVDVYNLSVLTQFATKYIIMSSLSRKREIKEHIPHWLDSIEKLSVVADSDHWLMSRIVQAFNLEMSLMRRKKGVRHWILSPQMVFTDDKPRARASSGDRSDDDEDDYQDIEATLETIGKAIAYQNVDELLDNLIQGDFDEERALLFLQKNHESRWFPLFARKYQRAAPNLGRNARDAFTKFRNLLAAEKQKASLGPLGFCPVRPESIRNRGKESRDAVAVAASRGKTRLIHDVLIDVKSTEELMSVNFSMIFHHLKQGSLKFVNKHHISVSWNDFYVRLGTGKPGNTISMSSLYLPKATVHFTIDDGRMFTSTRERFNFSLQIGSTEKLGRKDPPLADLIQGLISRILDKENKMDAVPVKIGVDFNTKTDNSCVWMEGILPNMNLVTQLPAKPSLKDPLPSPLSVPSFLSNFVNPRIDFVGFGLYRFMFNVFFANPEVLMGDLEILKRSSSERKDSVPLLGSTIYNIELNIPPVVVFMASRSVNGGADDVIGALAGLTTDHPMKIWAKMIDGVLTNVYPVISLDSARNLQIPRLSGERAKPIIDHFSTLRFLHSLIFGKPDGDSESIGLLTSLPLSLEMMDFARLMRLADHISANEHVILSTTVPNWADINTIKDDPLQINSRLMFNVIVNKLMEPLTAYHLNDPAKSAGGKPEAKVVHLNSGELELNVQAHSASPTELAVSAHFSLPPEYSRPDLVRSSVDDYFTRRSDVDIMAMMRFPIIRWGDTELVFDLPNVLKVRLAMDAGEIQVRENGQRVLFPQLGDFKIKLWMETGTTHRNWQHEKDQKGMLRVGTIRQLYGHLRDFARRTVDRCAFAGMEMKVSSRVQYAQDVDEQGNSVPYRSQGKLAVDQIFYLHRALVERVLPANAPPQSADSESYINFSMMVEVDADRAKKDIKVHLSDGADSDDESSDKSRIPCMHRVPSFAIPCFMPAFCSAEQMKKEKVSSQESDAWLPLKLVIENTFRPLAAGLGAGMVSLLSAFHLPSYPALFTFILEVKDRQAITVEMNGYPIVCGVAEPLKIKRTVALPFRNVASSSLAYVKPHTPGARDAYTVHVAVQVADTLPDALRLLFAPLFVAPPLIDISAPDRKFHLQRKRHGEQKRPARARHVQDAADDDMGRVELRRAEDYDDSDWEIPATFSSNVCKGMTLLEPPGTAIGLSDALPFRSNLGKGKTRFVHSTLLGRLFAAFMVEASGAGINMYSPDDPSRPSFQKTTKNWSLLNLSVDHLLEFSWPMHPIGFNFGPSVFAEVFVDDTEIGTLFMPRHNFSGELASLRVIFKLKGSYSTVEEALRALSSSGDRFITAEVHAGEIFRAETSITLSRDFLESLWKGTFTVVNLLHRLSEMALNPLTSVGKLSNAVYSSLPSLVPETELPLVEFSYFDETTVYIPEGLTKMNTVCILSKEEHTAEVEEAKIEDWRRWDLESTRFFYPFARNLRPGEQSFLTMQFRTADNVPLCGWNRNLEEVVVLFRRQHHDYTILPETLPNPLRPEDLKSTYKVYSVALYQPKYSVFIVPVEFDLPGRYSIHVAAVPQSHSAKPGSHRSLDTLDYVKVSLSEVYVMNPY